MLFSLLVIELDQSIIRYLGQAKEHRRRHYLALEVRGEVERGRVDHLGGGGGAAAVAGLIAIALD